MGLTKSALEEALKDPELRPRAKLDQISLKLMNDLGCKSVPREMYRLTFDEIETLRRIMESGEEPTGIKDKGPDAIKKAADKLQRKLEEYSAQKNGEKTT
jgi:hypothetical protein